LDIKLQNLKKAYDGKFIEVWTGNDCPYITVRNGRVRENDFVKGN